MRRSLRNFQLACNHAGLAHFDGVYFFHEFLRVLRHSSPSAEDLSQADARSQPFTGVP